MISNFNVDLNVNIKTWDLLFNLQLWGRIDEIRGSILHITCEVIIWATTKANSSNFTKVKLVKLNAEVLHILTNPSIRNSNSWIHKFITPSSISCVLRKDPQVGSNKCTLKKHGTLLIHILKHFFIVWGLIKIIEFLKEESWLKFEENSICSSEEKKTFGIILPHIIPMQIFV